MHGCKTKSIFYGMAIAFGMLLGVGNISQAGVIAGVVGSYNNAFDTAGPVNGFNDVTVTLKATAQFGPAGSGTLNFGGLFSWKGDLTIGANPTIIGQKLFTYCLEVNQDVHVPTGGPYNFVVTNDIGQAPIGAGTTPENMGSLAAGYIGELWANHYDGVIDSKANPLFATQQAVGAFQLAMWKLEYDTVNKGTAAGSAIQVDVNNTIIGVNWSAGSGVNFSATGADTHGMIALATTYLKELSKPTGEFAVNGGNEASLLALVNAGIQDQIFENTVGAPHFFVPEPASMVTWLLIGSVAGFAKLRRRRKIAG